MAAEIAEMKKRNEMGTSERKPGHIIDRLGGFCI